MTEGGIDTYKKLHIWADEQKRLSYYNPYDKVIKDQRRHELDKTVAKMAEKMQNKDADELIDQMSVTDSEE